MKNAVIAIMFLSAAALAQSPLGFAYPLGIPDYSVTGASAAIGGSGAAVVDEAMGIALNPANAAMGDRAAFSGLVSFRMTNIADGDSSNSVSGYAPKLLSLVIPIGRAGSLGFSMQNRYDANLKFYTKTTSLEEYRDDLNMTNSIEFKRNGGLTAWQAGWAYRFSNGAGIGVVYERLFFNRESHKVFESVFEYTGATFSSIVTETENVEFASNGVRFGMQIPVHEKVTLGAAAEVAFYADDNGTVKTTHNRRDSNPFLNTDIDSTERLFSVSLPPAINIGASYKPDDRWLFAADAKITLWESYSNTLDDIPVNKETYGVSVGARFVPAANLLSTPYLERIAYSAGLRYGTLPSGGSGAHEFGIAIGAGLPIPNDGGVIDIVLDFGRRTDSRFDGYAENVISFMLGINGGRNWYQREAARDY